MQPFFIAAPGTGIGKTLITTTLAWQLRQLGKKVTALKPIISGYDPHDEHNDTALILKSCGLPLAKADTISPWRFAAPLSPDMAADKEGKLPVDFDALVAFCKRSAKDYTLVETIGGVMTPINNHHTVLDWMEALRWPVILVTGSYLGALGHTLMALEVLQGRGLQVHTLIVSESEKGVCLHDTISTLEKFLLKPIPVVKIPRVAARGELWRHAPDISGTCA
jgi:dethiobiotin synthetase